MQNTQRGFSLIELIIAVAIVAILAGIALPSFQSSAEKGRRSDGQAALLDAASKMESYFYTNKTYTTDMTALGFTADPANSSEGYYALEVAAATSSCPISSCFKLQATAQGAQVNDGNLSLASSGEKLPADKW
ncbi:MAG: type IV pilin protein [Cellvibrionaceae bacterium]|nr:type IV pilin protein [Cellvibrionaceae bacterium]